MRGAKSGFTLTELLAVMVIMGILMALLIPAVMRARVETFKNLTKATIKSIEGAIELYKQAFGSPPPPPYQFFDATATPTWDVPSDAAYGAPGTKDTVYYYEDVDRDGTTYTLVEADWNIDIDHDGSQDLTVIIEPCLSYDSAATWDAATALDDSEALYLFLTARYSKSLPTSGHFGLQSDGSIVLLATVNAGPFITADATTCDIDEDGYPEFADPWGNPIRYNSNQVVGYYFFFPNPQKPRGVDIYSYGPNGIDEKGANDENSNTDDINNWDKK